MDDLRAWLSETVILFAYGLMRAGWAISFSLATLVPGQLEANIVRFAGLALAGYGVWLGTRYARVLSPMAAGEA